MGKEADSRAAGALAQIAKAKETLKTLTTADDDETNNRLESNQSTTNLEEKLTTAKTSANTNEQLSDYVLITSADAASAAASEATVAQDNTSVLGIASTIATATSSPAQPATAISTVEAQQWPHVSEQTVEKDYKSSIRIISSNNNDTTVAAAVGEVVEQSSSPYQHHPSQQTDQTALELAAQQRIDAHRARNAGRANHHSCDTQMRDALYATNYLDDAATTVTAALLPSKASLKDEQTTPTATGAVTAAARKQRANAGKSEMDEETQARQARNMLFTNKDTRIESIRFDDIVKPYFTDFGLLIDDAPIRRSLMSDALVTSVRAKLAAVKDFIESSLSSFPSIASSKDTAQSCAPADQSYECLVENECRSNDETSRLLFSYNYIEIDEILNRLVDIM